MDFFFVHYLLILQKRKRKCVFNQGELDALEYHSKVSLNKSIFCKYMVPDFEPCMECKAWLQTSSVFVACSTNGKLISLVFK